MGPRLARLPRDFLVLVTLGMLLFFCCFLQMLHQVWVQANRRQ